MHQTQFPDRVHLLIFRSFAEFSPHQRVALQQAKLRLLHMV